MEVNLKERYIPAFIMLIAGAITSIINIINKVEVITGLKRLLLVIIIFYILGLIAKAIIKKAFTINPKKEEMEEIQEEEKPSEENKE